ncbi:sec-independent protein translocase protein TATA, chloroplastic isoform X2 [Carica papaya]|uniref:sec-independent protein translocase protein TATA, chloroplastic isoform X2 n=1 Tax=Carica papaya TaxID=3649 RepID=UPI000B8CF998|nr:sec-independent protein translocase protein TATA, chloroplastic isoform X2 [Carica papaya]
MEISSITLLPSRPPSLPSLPLSSSHSSFFTNSTTVALFTRTKTKASSLILVRPRTRTGSGPARKGFTCNALFGLGVPELVVIAGVAALVFGPKKLPEVGRSIGKTVKSFQQAAKEFESELKKEPDSGTESSIEKPTASNNEDKEEKVSVSNDSV